MLFPSKAHLAAVRMFLMRAKDLAVGSEIYLMRVVVDSQNTYWMEKKKTT